MGLRAALGWKIADIRIGKKDIVSVVLRSVNRLCLFAKECWFCTVEAVFLNETGGAGTLPLGIYINCVSCER